MELSIRSYRKEDLKQMTDIWNDIMEAADSFPGDTRLSLREAEEMFAAQTASVCACLGEEILGLYILHPNNIGRCAHVANASYGVKKGCRGMGVGRKMVEHSLATAKEYGFKGLQFNAVVASNEAAIRLYLDLGFQKIGRIPNGYRLKDGTFIDIFIFYHSI